MNREIKFRAWDKRFNILADVAYLGIGFGANESYNGYDGEPCKPNLCREDILQLKENEGLSLCVGTLARDFIIMQYTGLKDFEGKEIYEGDILEQRGVYYDGKPYFLREIIPSDDSEKQFSCGCCETVFGYCIPSDISKYKIIGNVFETPELLKEE